MSLKLLRAVVVLPYKTGLPRDVAETSTHWTFDDSATAEPDCIDEATARLQLFWDNAPPAASTPIATSANLASILDRPRAGIQWYRVDIPTGDIEFVERRDLSISPPAAGGNEFPLEVSMCISFVGGDPATTGHEPVRRRRGRFFVGPLNSFPLTASGDLPVIKPAVIESLGEAAKRMAAANFDTGLTPVFWSVYSRASRALSRVETGWVDNEFDTQRRRQVAATSRFLWTAP